MVLTSKLAVAALLATGCVSLSTPDSCAATCIKNLTKCKASANANQAFCVSSYNECLGFEAIGDGKANYTPSACSSGATATKSASSTASSTGRVAAAKSSVAAAKTSVAAEKSSVKSSVAAAKSSASDKKSSALAAITGSSTSMTSGSPTGSSTTAAPTSSGAAGNVEPALFAAAIGALFAL